MAKRSKWKLKPICSKNAYHKSFLKRNLCISSDNVGTNVQIHDGRSFFLLKVKKEHVGCKFGEYGFTKRYTKKEKYNKK